MNVHTNLKINSLFSLIFIIKTIGCLTLSHLRLLRNFERKILALVRMSSKFHESKDNVKIAGWMTVKFCCNNLNHISSFMLPYF